MDGDESRRISKLEWRMDAVERQLATLSDAQKRVEETILRLSSLMEALAAARNAPGNGDD
jgi:chaperonin cofactor prefoldin